MRWAWPLLVAIGGIILAILLQENLAQAWTTITGWDAGKPTAASALVVMLAVGTIIGLAIASAARTSFAKRWLLRFQLRTVADVEDYFGVPVIGKTPDHKRLPPRFESSSGPIEEECYKTTLRLRREIAGPTRRVLVTGGASADGKSVLVNRLARVIAEMGSSVLVIDADLRQPRQHVLGGVDQRPGLTEFLAGSELIVHSHAGVDLICAGTIPSYSPHWLSALHLDTVVGATGKAYDWVLVDSPPVLGLADAPILAGLVDCVLITARLTEISAGVVKDALRAVQSVTDAKPFILLARVPVGQFANGSLLGWGYRYAYSYSYQPTEQHDLSSFSFAEIRTESDIRARRWRVAIVALFALTASWLGWRLLATPGPVRLMTSPPFHGTTRDAGNIFAVLELPATVPPATRRDFALDALAPVVREINRRSGALKGVERLYVRVQLDGWPSGRRHVSRLGAPMYPYLFTLRYDVRDITAARLENLTSVDVRRLATSFREPLSRSTVERPTATCRLFTFDDC